MKNKFIVIIEVISLLISIIILIQMRQLVVISSRRVTNLESEVSSDFRKACSALNTSLDSLVSSKNRQDISAAQTQFVGMGPLITLCTGGEVKLGLEDVDDYSFESLEKRVRFIQSKMKR